MTGGFRVRYVNDVLVEAEWLEAHLHDDGVRVVEINENPAAGLRAGGRAARGAYPRGGSDRVLTLPARAAAQ
jgi:hypothetical protein